jgi:hypothetical protein
MADDKESRRVSFGSYLDHPEQKYAGLIANLEKCGYQVSILRLQHTGSPHEYEEPTLISPNHNAYQGERNINLFTFGRADSLGIDLEAKVEQK